MSLASQAAGIEGTGGLMFQAQAPPGLGRLLRLPFYPNVAGVAGYVTGGGAAALSATVPTISWTSIAGADFTPSVAIPNSASRAQIQLITPQISWATLRIVGFEAQFDASTSSLAGAATLAVPAGSISQARLVVQDLQIGGGTNLFVHEDFADAYIYDADQPEFCGLRDYPILKSPNQCRVTCNVLSPFNTAPAGATTISLTFSVALICEVLVDQNYGAHVPGPYARKGAMVRQGGSFL